MFFLSSCSTESDYLLRSVSVLEGSEILLFVDYRPSDDTFSVASESKPENLVIQVHDSVRTQQQIIPPKNEQQKVVFKGVEPGSVAIETFRESERTQEENNDEIIINNTARKEYFDIPKNTRTEFNVPVTGGLHSAATSGTSLEIKITLVSVFDRETDSTVKYENNNKNIPFQITSPKDVTVGIQESHLGISGTGEPNSEVTVHRVFQGFNERVIVPGLCTSCDSEKVGEFTINNDGKWSFELNNIPNYFDSNFNSVFYTFSQKSILNEGTYFNDDIEIYRIGNYGLNNKIVEFLIDGYIYTLKEAGTSIITGSTDNPAQITGSIASDFIVIGDLRDIGLQTYFLLFDSSEFDGDVLGFAFAGIVPLPSEFLSTSLKNIYKVLKPIKKLDPNLYNYVVKKVIPRITREGDTESAKKLIQSLIDKKNGVKIPNTRHGDWSGFIKEGTKEFETVAQIVKDNKTGLFDDGFEAFIAKYPKGVEYKKHDLLGAVPDFSPYVYMNKKFTVSSGQKLTGDVRIDERLTKNLMGDIKKPDDHVWHHLPDCKSMILIPKDVHAAFQHTGGAHLIEKGLCGD